MTRRQRLLASLQGKPVDRPPVSFYEIGGLGMSADDPSPFNIYNDPSWSPLLELAESQTDLIRMRGPHIRHRHPEVRQRFFHYEQHEEAQTRWTHLRVTVGGRTLTQVQRRDAAVDTVWTVEHLLKDEEDVKAYLQLPDEALAIDADGSNILEEDKRLGERGIVMIDTADPLCIAASQLSMEDYTVLAFSNPPLFHALLQQTARHLYPVIETIALACPGHLWRIYGPEYATEPYLPARLFGEYVVPYVNPMVAAIHSTGGYARIHCHGRLRNVLPYIRQMGADALDPIEPPPQGDMELCELRREYGQELALFGNIEASEIENLEPAQFEQRVASALRDGTAGQGRGFILMPSACPYGRTITARTLANYRTMVRLATESGHA